MKYISQLNAFYELLPSNPLTPKAICLYSVLLHIDNKCLWKERFTVANTYLVNLAGIDRRTLDRVRNELIQKKYIEYKKGKGSQAGEYTIIPLYVQNDMQNNLIAQNDTQIVTQNDAQMSHKLSTLIDKDIDIYSNLLKNAREKFHPTSFSEKVKAQLWAATQEEWRTLTDFERKTFMARLSVGSNDY